MTQRVGNSAGQPQAEVAEATAAAYERPRILYREPLETIAPAPARGVRSLPEGSADDRQSRALARARLRVGHLLQ